MLCGSVNGGRMWRTWCGRVGHGHHCTTRRRRPTEPRWSATRKVFEDRTPLYPAPPIELRRPNGVPRTNVLPASTSHFYHSNVILLRLLIHRVWCRRVATVPPSPAIWITMGKLHFLRFKFARSKRRRWIFALKL